MLQILAIYGDKFLNCVLNHYGNDLPGCLWMITEKRGGGLTVLKYTI